MSFKTMSKEFYWFNEDTNEVQNFYFNNWENFGEQVDDGPPLIVGVIIKFIFHNILMKFILFLDNNSSR